jgi:hypothetical protein
VGGEGRRAAAVDELEHGVEVKAAICGDPRRKLPFEPGRAQPLDPPGDQRARLGLGGRQLVGSSLGLRPGGTVPYLRKRRAGKTAAPRAAHVA